MTAAERLQRIHTLRERRPRDRFRRWSFITLGLLFVLCWFSGEFALDAIDWNRRIQNGQRFLHRIVPYPLTQSSELTLPQKTAVVWSWTADLMAREGWAALGHTLVLSIAAITLAGVLATLSLPLASRRLCTSTPYLNEAQSRKRPRLGWATLRMVTRGVLVLSRSIPEYILAFFLISAFGLNAWPAVLALGLHNMGILGRLGSELVDNLPSDLPETQRALGATRLQIFAFAAWPSLLSRFLVFFFYRWETCVRDATVLGMLGIPALGYSILEARAKDRLDEMLFFVLLGSLLVLVGDFFSAAVRWWTNPRRALR